MPHNQKLVAGVGINDANYPVYSKEGSKFKACAYYATWAGMLQRCYNKESQIRNPSYIDCAVCPEWHSFMSFREWAQVHRQPDYHLDKDLKVWQNKVYSPETCAYISLQLNNALLINRRREGELPSGVFFNHGKYVSRIGKTGNQRVLLGSFDSPELAYAAYLRAKADYLLTFIPQHLSLESYIRTRSIFLYELAETRPLF